MTAPHPTTTRLATLTAHVDQLTRPIHVAIQGRVITHPALLDQLRAACVPGRSTTYSGGRQPPGSRPPLRVDAVDTLAEINVGISAWHARLALPSPPRNADWQKATLRAFVGAAPSLAPALVDYLTDEVIDWWRAAAVASGWQPAQLRKLQ